MALRVETPEDKIKTKKIEFGAFIDPAISYTMYYFYSKYEIIGTEKIVNSPFRDDFSLQLFRGQVSTTAPLIKTAL